MRETELFADWLALLRQEKLKLAHSYALGSGDFVDVKIAHHEAALCERTLAALAVLNRDSGRFIREFLNQEELDKFE